MMQSALNQLLEWETNLRDDLEIMRLCRAEVEFEGNISFLHV
jgi:hypothetical protein